MTSPRSVAGNITEIIRNSTVIDPTSLNKNATDVGSSPILFRRLFDAFSEAIHDQSKSVEIPDQRMKYLVTYCISSYAAICMSTAACLNRIVIFAASRRNKQLPKISIWFLRLLALFILYQGSFGLIVALKSYSLSPWLVNLIPTYFDFDPKTFSNYKFLGIKYFPSYYQTTLEIKRAVPSSSIFSTTVSETSEIYIKYGPTPAILKPFYLALCISQIIDTFISVASGVDPGVENGLTLFEYSLAFQEVQSSNRPSIQLIAFAFVGLFNKVCTHLQALLNTKKYRLIPSTIINLFSFVVFIHTIVNGLILNIPLIIFISYLPQILIALMIIVCIIIFFLATIFKGSFQDLTITEMFQNSNSINVSMSDDFYTVLANVGEFFLTSAGDYSYFKEFNSIQLPLNTFVDRQKVESDKAQREKSKLLRAKLKSGYGNDLEIHPDLINKRLMMYDTNGKIPIISRRWYTLRKIMDLSVDFILWLLINKKPRYIINRENNEQENNTGFENEFSRESSEQLEDLLSMEDESPDYIIEIEEESDDDDDDDDDDEGEDGDDADKSVEFSLNYGEETAVLDEDQDIDEDYDNEHIRDNSMVEIMNSDELLHLVAPETPEDIEMTRILQAHLKANDDYQGRITRSRFRDIYYSDKDLVLEDLINEKRLHQSKKPKFKFPGSRKSSLSLDQEDEYDEDELFSGLGKCVICHTNSRQIIVWPCKCLSICEACRVSLIVRNFTECVCCRSKVEGYSKVYIP